MAGYTKLDSLPRESLEEEEELGTPRGRKLHSYQDLDEMSGRITEKSSSASPSLSPAQSFEQLTLTDNVEQHFSRRAQWFGGPSVRIGPRTAPAPPHLHSEVDQGQGGSDDGSRAIKRHVDEEAGHAIKYRTCSWKKTAALMFSEYISLTILNFAWSYSVLGMIPGILLTIFTACSVQYTSLIIWEFCLRHAEVRDICDVGMMLFGGGWGAWFVTSVMLVLNNIFVQGIHIQMGSDYLLSVVSNTDLFGCRPVAFAALVCFTCWIFSVPRTFHMLAKFASVSALITFVGVVLATVFAGVQKHPAGYPEMGANRTGVGTAEGLTEDPTPVVTAWMLSNTTGTKCITAAMNIAYLFIGKVAVPSFIAEMKEPRDFPKALWVCTVGQVILYSIVGGLFYSFTGNQYITAPVFASLQQPYKTIAFTFMVPSIVFIGVLFASITARFIFFRAFRGSRHLHEHTLVGWGSWIGILFGTWIIAFLIAELVPFFSSLVSLTSSLFDGFFGFIFWAVAFYRMRKADRKVGVVKGAFSDWFECAVNAGLLVIGALFLMVGTWASVQDIRDEFRIGNVKGVFSCDVNTV